ncbi:hypothetical protein BHYA_0129g00110 [Botrytis hyacinthi]|uniref:Heterokaryon incompatibility domain-containing protein n=1 Tax=Botrytis hyacinthi TaxID=278943 RepID=A0A4Z1GLH6_9HELO|nr:hypothetical protein BHYA_0129g00110 [Botrytis hyacinthi]
MERLILNDSPSEDKSDSTQDSSLDRPKNVNSLESCEVCTKIFSIFKLAFEHENTTVELGQVSDIFNSSCVHRTFIEKHRPLWPFPAQYEKQPLTLGKNRNETSANLRIYWNTENAQGVQLGWPFGLISRETEARHPGRVRMLDPEWVDVEVLKNWRTRCIEDHGDACHQHKISNLESTSPLRLIDVENGCIVSTEEEESVENYVTLSYTWGQTKNFVALKSNFEDLRQPGVLLNGDIAEQIPQTIRDAIAIVGLLGGKYLWVDSLCIIQDEDEPKWQELQRMHLIYANSFLCLIAEEGNSSHGLRGIKGVSFERKIEQETHDLAGGEKLTHQNESWEASPHAKEGYRSRAWTFQEYIFAKRRLVFSKGPLTWQCNSEAWYENLMQFPEAGAHFAREDNSGQFGWMQLQLPTLQALSGLVDGFNAKLLTYPEDVSRAFAGIQSYLRRLYQGGLIFGLPEFFFDIALFWYGEVDSSRRKVSPNFSGNATQNGLPSWSWMGWNGHIRFPEDCEFESIKSFDLVGFTEPVTEWYIMETHESNTRRRISSQWHQYRIGVIENDVGWVKKEYELGPPLANRFYRSKDLRSHTCSHESQSGPTLYWYTLPSVEPQNSPRIHPQTQYLYCETTRAFLYGTTDKLCDFRGKYRLQLIVDDAGVFAGGITLGTNYLHDSNRLRDGVPTTAGSNRMEFVAIAKGWTSVFTKCKVNEKIGLGEFYVSKCDVPDMEEGDEENVRKWKEERAAKDDCVFVLWIEWVHGVAFKLGTGIILEEAWERVREKEKVKLVLG